MAKDLLFEIGTEEIPARFMPGVLKQLAQLAETRLTELRLAYAAVRVCGTPRRMALIVEGLADKQADKSSENKGPSVKIAFDAEGNATKAAQGFARGQGVDVSELVVKDGYIYAMVHEVGQAVDAILPEFLLNLLHSLNFPKNMRWSDLDLRFVRPIRWLLALHGSDVVPVSIAGVDSSNTTRGHRFLSEGEVVIASAADYAPTLAKHFVLVDPEERRNLIRQQIEALAQQQGGVAAIDEELLDEVVYLVEYPTALCGTFEAEYLELPAEAVITPMREHQRYFPVTDAAGKLLPMFITVRNGGDAHIDLVRHGNERVLKARLADARFFFEEDKKVKLDARVEKLKTVVFQEGLGTMYDKSQRLMKLAAGMAGLAIAQPTFAPSDLERAAFLAKADLVTGMVCEFTELQGIMGREYAKLQGESEAVAEAIYEHYLPRFAGDALPQTVIGRFISMADKMDNIVATFSRGLIPTGSQDPYALRRQALGIVHILLDGQYHVSLRQMVEQAMDLLHISDAAKREALLAEVEDFFRLRLKNILSDEGVRYDVVDAVLASGIDDLFDACLRAKALASDGTTAAMQKAVQAFTRVANLAKHAGAEQVSAELLVNPAEQALYQEYVQAKEAIARLVAEKNYPGIFSVMANLAAPIDAFFTAVMVMDENMAVRNNRLALLQGILALTNGIADFSKLVTA